MAYWQNRRLQASKHTEFLYMWIDSSTAVPDGSWFGGADCIDATEEINSSTELQADARTQKPVVSSVFIDTIRTFNKRWLRGDVLPPSGVEYA